MSRIQNDQVFPAFVNYLPAEILARKISAALRQDFGDQPHAVKRLSVLLGVAPRTVRNWYEARNIPSLLHLLHLSKISGSLSGLLLQEIGGGKPQQARQGEQRQNPGSRSASGAPKSPEVYRSTRKVYRSGILTFDSSLGADSARNPNRRRVLILEMLQRHRQIRTDDLCRACGVSRSTAKSDMAALVRDGLIRFKGAKRNGWYEAV